MARRDPLPGLAATIRLATSALRDAGIPFLLGGSLAAWARGGPETQNDLDLVVKPQDAQAAIDVLVAAGMRQEPVPEDWLLKAWHGEVMVDVIFHPVGLEITDEVLARGEMISVLAVSTPVMALDDVLATKLLALDEHGLDYTSVLAIARSLREQIDWQALRTRTAGSPFAAAFFTLVTELGIAPAGTVDPAGLSAEPSRKGRVRVIHGSSNEPRREAR
jgi:hypothetical protein